MKIVPDLNEIQSIEDDSTVVSLANVSKCKDSDDCSKTVDSKLQGDGCTTPPPTTPPLVLDRDNAQVGMEEGKSPRSTQVLQKKERFRYRDFSTFPVPEGLPSGPKKPQGSGDVLAIQKLPTKLYAILSNPAIQHIISWLPHGRSWKVHDPKAFMDTVMKHYFPYTNNYYSFIRLVNAWGFRRMSRGPSRNSYWHEMFLRGLPHLHSQMRRLTVKDKKEALDSDDEPDLFEQSRLHPLLPPMSGMTVVSRRPSNLVVSYSQQQHQSQHQSNRAHAVEKGLENVMMIGDDSPENASPKSVLGTSNSSLNSSCSSTNSPGLMNRSSAFTPTSLQDVSAMMRYQRQQQRRRAILASMNAAYPTSVDHLYLPNIMDGPESNGFSSRRHTFPAGKPGATSSNAVTASSIPSSSHTTSSQALRLHQVELAATRRAMEAHLEELRSEEERLAFVAAMSSSSPSSVTSSGRRNNTPNFHRNNHPASSLTATTSLRDAQSRYHFSHRAAEAAASLPMRGVGHPSIQPRFVPSESSPFLTQQYPGDWM